MITSRTGFIGCTVEQHLAKDPDFRVETVSLRNEDWQSMDFGRYDSILHTAGIAHVSTKSEMAGQYDAVNHILTSKVAQKAKADGAGQFIFMSSIIVYGDASPAGVPHVITPDTPANPSGAYGKSKLDAENDLHLIEDSGFPVAILRPPMIYGAGCKGNYNMLSGLARSLPIFPDFGNSRSILYVENLAELIRLIILRRDHGTFYPQDDKAHSVTEIVKTICQVNGKRMHFSRALSPLVRLAGRGGIVRRAFGDLAYSPEMSVYPENYRIVGFEDAIQRTEGGASWQA